MTLRAIKLTALEVLSSPPAADDADAATVDYAYSYKRRIDERGSKIKTEQPVVRSVERAEFRRGEGRRWLLLNSAPLAAAQAATEAAAEAGATAGGS